MIEDLGTPSPAGAGTATGPAQGGGQVLPLSHAVLPPGVELASIGRRIGAFFLSIVLSIITLGIGYVIWGLIVWGRGTTPALQVLGMRCWKPETSRPATWGTYGAQGDRRPIRGGDTQRDHAACIPDPDAYEC